MTAEAPAPKPMAVFRWLRCTFSGGGTSTVTGAVPIAIEPRATLIGVQPIPTKPRRKGLGPKQLKWLRTNCQPFADMERRAKAAKGAIVGSKAK